MTDPAVGSGDLFGHLLEWSGRAFSTWSEPSFCFPGFTTGAGMPKFPTRGFTTDAGIPKLSMRVSQIGARFTSETDANGFKDGARTNDVRSPLFSMSGCKADAFI